MLEYSRGEKKKKKDSSKVILEKKFLLLCVFTAAPSSPEVWEGEKEQEFPFLSGTRGSCCWKLTFLSSAVEFYGRDALVTHQCPRNQWLILNHRPHCTRLPDERKTFPFRGKPSGAGCECVGWVSERGNL